MEKPFWHSKKFWAAAVATSVPIVNHFFGWGLTQEAIMQIVTPVVAYILGQGLADLGKNKS
mgnify:CR=1 FL=1|tara:strand:+ start:491 stop:673 length:183 start_codon:yes stop_codon:yes gene_type:complete